MRNLLGVLVLRLHVADELSCGREEDLHVFERVGDAVYGEEVEVAVVRDVGLDARDAALKGVCHCVMLPHGALHRAAPLVRMAAGQRRNGRCGEACMPLEDLWRAQLTGLQQPVVRAQQQRA